MVIDEIISDMMWESYVPVLTEFVNNSIYEEKMTHNDVNEDTFSNTVEWIKSYIQNNGLHKEAKEIKDLINLSNKSHEEILDEIESKKKKYVLFEQLTISYMMPVAEMKAGQDVYQQDHEFYLDSFIEFLEEKNVVECMNQIIAENMKIENVEGLF